MFACNDLRSALQAYEGPGSCDGTVAGERLFECQPNYGLFISLDRIISFHINDIDGVFESAASSPALEDNKKKNKRLKDVPLTTGCLKIHLSLTALHMSPFFQKAHQWLHYASSTFPSFPR